MSETVLLSFDTEITGLYRKSAPLNDPSQPHLVSLSALQARSKNYFIQQSMSRIVYPADWDWDDSPNSEDRAFQVHKLSVKYCTNYGRSEKDVLDDFLSLWGDNPNCLLIAHNLAFDRNVIACAIARYYGQGELLNSWLAAPGFCTMNESRNIVNAQTKPNVNGVTRLKNPNLAEAYEFFTDEPLEDHHSSNRDTVACLQIYAGIQATC